MLSLRWHHFQGKESIAVSVFDGRACCGEEAAVASYRESINTLQRRLWVVAIIDPPLRRRKFPSPLLRRSRFDTVTDDGDGNVVS